jgi:lambda family phage minor tail protein L
MRAPGATLQNALAEDQVRAAWLAEIQFSAGTVYYALHDADITVDGQLYSANSGKVSQLAETLEGQAPRLRLQIQNLDGTMATNLGAEKSVTVGEGLTKARRMQERGIDVALRMVLLDALAEGAVFEVTFELDAYTWNDNEARLDLSASPVLRGIQVPGRRTQTWYCPWTYKGTECGYTGSLKTCDYTYDGPNGCTKHFSKTEAKRFGGFIGRPQANIAAV